MEDAGGGLWFVAFSAWGGMILVRMERKRIFPPPHPCFFFTCPHLGLLMPHTYHTQHHTYTRGLPTHFYTHAFPAATYFIPRHHHTHTTQAVPQTGKRKKKKIKSRS